MDKLLLGIITIIHACFLTGVILIPFSNSNYLLLIYIIIMPFIMLHWILNNNNCSLTLLERELRKKIYGKYSKADCLTCRLIEPVYDFLKNNQKFSILIYLITLLLLFMAIFKLGYKYKTCRINNWLDLLRF